MKVIRKKIHQGKIRRKIIVKTNNTLLLEKSGIFNVYQIKTFDKKTLKERKIFLETDVDLLQRINDSKTLLEVVFYVEKDKLESLAWKVTKNDYITFQNVPPRIYPKVNKPTIGDEDIKKTQNKSLKNIEQQPNIIDTLNSSSTKLKDDFVEPKNNKILLQQDDDHITASDVYQSTVKKQDNSWKEMIEKRLSTLEEDIKLLLMKQTKLENVSHNPTDKIGELKEILLDFVNNNKTDRNYCPKQEKISEERLIKSRRNWKQRGFDRIQAYFNINKIDLINVKKIHGNTLRTYVFNAKVLKKLRKITLQTTETFTNNTNVNFYISKNLINHDHWEINDFENQITFFSHTNKQS